MSNYVLTPSAVRKLRGALAATPGNSGAAGAPSPVNIDDYPPPFTVRWSASAYYGAGGWVIWLPDKTRLFYVDNAYKGSFINNIDLERSLPAGWYYFNAIAASDTAVWLNISIHESTGSTTLSFYPYSTRPPTGFKVISLLVATMSSDATTGAKYVKQFIDSAVVIGGSSGGSASVTLDDISTDWNSGNQVQIKDWDTGTPASSTTIAQDIHDGNTTAQGTVVERTTGGAMKYKKPGTLAQLLGSSVSLSSQKILTGLSWNTSTHRLVISSANISVANGVITSWTANADENFETTAIRSIIN